MATEIDEKWLASAGVNVDDGKKTNKLIDMVLDELELRVGIAIEEKLTAKQLDEFDSLQDEDERVEWLDKACPEYPAIVESVTSELAAEITKSKNKPALIKKWASA